MLKEKKNYLQNESAKAKLCIIPTTTIQNLVSSLFYIAIFFCFDLLDCKNIQLQSKIVVYIRGNLSFIQNNVVFFEDISFGNNLDDVKLTIIVYIKYV